ncbi:MAG: carboxy terminal-processing peptidase [Pseudohongiella sp.]|nr:carboxy terminal-processing peptidase [Pseudohongiella sp.]
MRGTTLNTVNHKLKHGVALKPWYSALKKTGGTVGASLLLAWMFSSPLAAQDAAATALDVQEEDVLAVLSVDALYQSMTPQAVYGRTAIELLRELETKHYSPVSFDDRFSGEVFDYFIKALDGQKLYFLDSDINALSSLRAELDNSLIAGDLQPGFDIYNLYHRRVLERLVWTVEFVENELETLSFDTDEQLQIDRKDAPWAQNTEELDNLWRQRIKSSALSLSLTGMEMHLIQDRLSKRYRNQLTQIAKTNDRDVFQAYMATVARTVDPHTSYFSPRDSENFNMGLRGSLQGIGAQLTSEDEYTKVAELIKGGPAEQAGELKAGDRIIGIAQGADGEMKDVIGLRLDDVVDQIRGEKGTTVRLSVIPAEAAGEAAAREILIVRDTVELSEQFARSEVIDIGVGEDHYKVGVITLPSFYFDFEAAAAGLPNYRSSARDVRALLEELKSQDVEAVVVDLRYNGGGSLNEANELVGLFIESGPTVQIRYSGQRNGFVRSYGDADVSVVYDGPMAVLVNRASASASEIFAGAIQDYQRGVVLGGQTFGKGTVQEIIPMNYGQVKLTRSKFYRISGASTQHRGVLPDINFPDRYQAIETMGESNLDGALPWDTVRPVEFRTYHPIRQIMPELQARHEERAARDADFIFLNDSVERMLEARQRTTIPLNRDALKAQRDADRRAAFDANNLRLLAKGLPLEVWEEESGEELDSQLALQDEDAIDSDEELKEEDPLLLESGRILVDMAELLGRPMASAPRSEPVQAASVSTNPVRVTQ